LKKAVLIEHFRLELVMNHARMEWDPILAWFLTSARRKRSNLLNCFFKLLQIKRDVYDSQKSIEVLYHRPPKTFSNLYEGKNIKVYILFSPLSSGGPPSLSPSLPRQVDCFSPKDIEAGF